MVDWLWFFAGFSTDAVILTALMVVIGPWVIERWIERNLASVIKEFIESPAFADIRTELIKQFKGAIFGGRPMSLKGVVKRAGAELFAQGVGGVVQRIGTRLARPAAEAAADGVLEQ
jgi:hypothetical protein